MENQFDTPCWQNPFMLWKLLDDIRNQTFELVAFIKSPLFHRPEYNIDGGIEMVFIMKRLKK